MLYDFRPTGWKMTIILLQQPAINRAEEYTERRAERALQCEASARVYAESRARIQVNTFAALQTRRRADTGCVHALPVQ